MLKRLVNECRFNLTIHTEGPVLVRSGYGTVSGPDMTPVRTYRNGKTEVYLPGSSLKGVFRSHIEKVIRTLKDDIVCNPFVKPKEPEIQGSCLVCTNYTEVSCGDKFEERQKDNSLRVGTDQWRHTKEDLSNEQVYRDSCPACRLFGSTSFIGRVAISDAYLKSEEKTEQRDGVGIDRFTGGAATASQAKFDLEVVSSGVVFETNIYLRNFEVWQLGMLMLIVQDLEDSLIRIGSGRSRGLGNVTCTISEISINYIGSVKGKSAKDVWGLGKLLGNKSYGTATNDQLTVQNPPTEEIHGNGIRKIATFTSDSLDNLKEAAVESFVKKIQSWKIPKAMEFDHLQFQRV